MRRTLIVCCMIVLMTGTGCVIYEGAYLGRVIDEETREPIKDVVALGVWYDEHVTLAGGWSEYYDAREAVTDENGDFLMPGQGFRALKGLDMVLTVFKAGYSYERGLWGSFMHPARKQKFKMDGGRLVIPLRKLSMEEQKKQESPDFPSKTQGKKIKLYLQEINESRAEQGLRPVGTER